MLLESEESKKVRKLLVDRANIIKEHGMSISARSDAVARIDWDLAGLMQDILLENKYLRNMSNSKLK